MKKDRKTSKDKQRRPKAEFEQQMLDLARVTRVVKGGRRFRFRATIVIGNRKGKVGVGVAKGADVSQAIQKATADAKKNMITVSLDGNTISHEVLYKYGSARVLLKPTTEGRGVIAGGAMRAVVDLVGIRDVVAKSQGCSNKLNVARATIAALKKLKEPKNVPATEDQEQKVDKTKSVTDSVVAKVAMKKEVKTVAKKVAKKTAVKKVVKKASGKSS